MSIEVGFNHYSYHDPGSKFLFFTLTLLGLSTISALSLLLKGKWSQLAKIDDLIILF
ncbi:MAG: hypothetical protein P0S96_01525 [Simkaniaceae bacterium]|nr:hypothetical protein [Candidatus Sacchlamyda saccharinae]